MSSSGLFFGTCRNIMKNIVIADVTVKSIIGIGSSSWEIIGETAEKALAKVLHSPIAVAANKVGKRYEFAE